MDDSFDIKKAEKVFETMTTAGVVPNVPDLGVSNSLDIKKGQALLRDREDG